MAIWNNNNFVTLCSLYASNQQYLLYDGAPRTGLPTEISTLDKEIDDFATELSQKVHWVYRPISFDDSAEYSAFKEQALQLARPLLDRRRQACERFNRKNRLYASLPLELQWWIFELAVGGQQVGDEISNPSELSRTLQLASVASLWRSTTVTNPRMWASFRLLPSPEDEINQARVEGLEYFLPRTKNTHLHVHLVVGDEWGTHFYRIVDILRQEAHRIRTLLIESMLCEESEKTLLGNFDFPFPNANAIAIHSSSSHRLITPNVARLRLDMLDVSSYHPYFQGLAFLDITGVSWYRLRFILQTAVTLKKLSVVLMWQEPLDESDVLKVNDHGALVIISGSGREQRVTQVWPLVHTELEDLTLNNGDALQTLTLPNLKNLYVYKQDTLGDFLARSACQLVRFRVSEPSDFDTLVGLNTLQHLYIESLDGYDCDRLFRKLVERSGKHPSSRLRMFPFLKSITIFIRSRRPWPSTTTRPHFLLSILIAFQNFHVSSLESFELYTENADEYGRRANDETENPYAFIDIAQALDEQDPEKTPILVNGHPIRFYLLSPWSSYNCNGEPGRDRLDMGDWVLMGLIRVQVAGKRVVEKILNRNWRDDLRLRIRRILGLRTPWDSDGSWSNGTWDGGSTSWE